MRCRRCRGLMVERACWEKEWTHVSRRWGNPFYLWSCLNCGEMVDRTILFNRTHPAEEMASRRHGLHWKRIRELVAAQMQEVA